MRVTNNKTKIYALHDTLTPNNVRFTYYTETTPEVGDSLIGGFGEYGAEIRSTVTAIRQLSKDAYEITLTGQ